MGESSSKPFPARGVHRPMSQPIGMKTNPRRRTGCAGVRTRGVAAGTIASRSGRERVIPSPRRKRRRGMALRVIQFSEFKFMGFSSG
jgi:hypothetical protein